MAYFARAGPGRGAVTAACGTLRGRPDPAAAGVFACERPGLTPTKLTVFIHSDHGVVGVQWGFTLGRRWIRLSVTKLPDVLDVGLI